MLEHFLHVRCVVHAGTIAFALKEVADRRLLSAPPPRGLSLSVAAMGAVHTVVLGLALAVRAAHSLTGSSPLVATPKSLRKPVQ